MSKTLKTILTVVGVLAAIAGAAYLVLVGFDQIKQIFLGETSSSEYDDYADVE